MRAPAQSETRLGSSVRILTVGIDDPWTVAAIESVGLLVLRVGHPLPACERIRVTRPVVVVVGANVRPIDLDHVAHAAAEVAAPVVEVAFVEEGRLALILRRMIETRLAERGAPQALGVAQGRATPRRPT